MGNESEKHYCEKEGIISTLSADVKTLFKTTDRHHDELKDTRRWIRSSLFLMVMALLGVMINIIITLNGR